MTGNKPVSVPTYQVIFETHFQSLCNSSFVQVVSISFFWCTYKVLLEPSRCPSVWMSVCLSHLNYSKTARPIDIKVSSVDLFTYLLVLSLRRSSHICERSVQFSFFHRMWQCGVPNETDQLVLFEIGLIFDLE